MLLLNVLISTIDAGITEIGKMLKPPRPDVSYIVSHQYRDERYNITPPGLVRDDVSIYRIQGSGLSRNRNNALYYANGNIAMIADDDVTFLHDSFDTILNVYKSNPECDIICFKIKTPDKEDEYKKYPDKAYEVGNRPLHYFSSIEITFRIDSIKRAGIWFDERFGLGSHFNWGEEKVFLNDAIKNGLKVCYYPEFTVIHPVESTIKSFNKYDKRRVIYKGGVEARKYGWKVFTVIAIEALRKRKDLAQHKKSLLAYFYQLLTGAFYILFKRRGKEYQFWQKD